MLLKKYILIDIISDNENWLCIGDIGILIFEMKIIFFSYNL